MLSREDKKHLRSLRQQIEDAGPEEREELFAVMDRVLRAYNLTRAQVDLDKVTKDDSDDFFDNMPV